jgi:hypothetical protein
MLSGQECGHRSAIFYSSKDGTARRSESKNKMGDHSSQERRNDLKAIPATTLARLLSVSRDERNQAGSNRDVGDIRTICVPTR